MCNYIFMVCDFHWSHPPQAGDFYSTKHRPFNFHSLIFAILFFSCSLHDRKILYQIISTTRCIYSVSQKNPPWGLVAIFPKRLGIFQPNFTRLLRVPIYARLWIFIQLPATLTKLCHIKRDHPVHSIRAKCPPSAETHFLTFFKTVRNFSSKFYLPITRSYLRWTTNFYSIICNFDEVMQY